MEMREGNLSDILKQENLKKQCPVYESTMYVLPMQLSVFGVKCI